MITLRLPLKDIHVNQEFGKNYVDFYTKLGMLGHNGIDFRANNGCPLYACHDGIIRYCGTDSGGGVEIDIWNKEGRYKTIYYHLKNYIITQNQEVKAGDLIGYCDNTGQMTTGNHLHLGFKLTDKDGNTIDWDNGYKGASDPAPYFTMTYNGLTISNKDWDKSRAYHRYYRGRPKGGYINELKVIPYMIRRLKRLPNNEEINACVYGGWDIEAVSNSAMNSNWGQLKKVEYNIGDRPYD